MKQPPPEAMWNSLPDYLRECLAPQNGNDFVIVHVKKHRVAKYHAIMLLLGFKFINGYFLKEGQGQQSGSVGSDNWANVRDIYNWINGTYFAPTIDMEMGTGGKLMINVIG